MASIRPAPIPSIRTVGELLDLYLADLESRGIRSIRDIRSRIDCYVRPAFGQAHIDDLTPRSVSAWVAAMRLHLPAMSVWARYEALKAALEHGRSAGVLDQNPCRNLPRGTLPPKRAEVDSEAEVMSVAEICRALDAASRPVDRALWATLALTGMRLGEALELRRHDILPGHPLPVIRIERSWSRKTGRVELPKAGSGRTVPMHPALAAELDAMGHGLLFARDDGTHQQDKTVLNRWYSALQRAGLSLRRLHSIRHSFVSIALNSGADWRVVEAMTHPSRASGRSLATYAHYSHEKKCEEILRIRWGSTSDKTDTQEVVDWEGGASIEE